GDLRDALGAAEGAVAVHATFGMGTQDVKHGFLHALEAAFGLGDRDKVDELCSIVEKVPAGLRPPFLTAHARRFRALLGGAEPSAEADYASAAEQMRRLELPFHLAVVLLEQGEWLVAQGRSSDAEPFVAEARETFVRLAATPWLERAARVGAGGLEP